MEKRKKPRRPFKYKYIIGEKGKDMAKIKRAHACRCVDDER